MDVEAIIETIRPYLANPLIAGPIGGGLGTLLSLWVRGLWARRSARHEIADRMLEVQKSLGDLAYAKTSEWGEGDKDKFKKMVFQQFFGRIEDAIQLSKNTHLKVSVSSSLRDYKARVEEFADKWSTTVRRREGKDGYWESYDKTWEKLHELLKLIGHFTSIERDVGKMPNRDEQGKRRPNTLGYIAVSSRINLDTPGLKEHGD